MVTLTEEEQAVLREANSFVGFESHPLWVGLRQHLEEELDQIELKLQNHFVREEYPDAALVFRLSLQRYERKKVILEVLAEIESAKANRDAVLEALKEQNEHHA